MDGIYDRLARKQDVTLSLNADILERAKPLPDDLSERVEKLLAAEIAKVERGQRLDATLAALNEFDAEYGSFADEHLDHL